MVDTRPQVDSHVRPQRAPSYRESYIAEIPTSDRYVRALELMNAARRISDAQWRMLRAHYRAPEHTMTATELAAAAGFNVYSGVNLHYGTFGANLARKLEWPVPPDEPQASALATFAEGAPDAPHTRWTLRPQVVAALDRLKWFPAAARTTP